MQLIVIHHARMGAFASHRINVSARRDLKVRPASLKSHHPVFPDRLSRETQELNAKMEGKQNVKS